MPHRRSQATVAQFLRDALAVDALGVPELEARARATGLLGQRQSITHSRVFKRAKKSLGIRSRRAGFGARSQWLWELSPQNEASIKAERGAAPHNRFPGLIASPFPSGIASPKSGARENLMQPVRPHEAVESRSRAEGEQQYQKQCRDCHAPPMCCPWSIRCW